MFLASKLLSNSYDFRMHAHNVHSDNETNRLISFGFRFGVSNSFNIYMISSKIRETKQRLISLSLNLCECATEQRNTETKRANTRKAAGTDRQITTAAFDHQRLTKSITIRRPSECFLCVCVRNFFGHYNPNECFGSSCCTHLECL